MTNNKKRRMRKRGVPIFMLAIVGTVVGDAALAQTRVAWLRSLVEKIVNEMEAEQRRALIAGSGWC